MAAQPDIRPELPPSRGHSAPWQRNHAASALPDHAAAISDMEISAERRPRNDAPRKGIERLHTATLSAVYIQQRFDFIEIGRGRILPFMKDILEAFARQIHAAQTK